MRALLALAMLALPASAFATTFDGMRRTQNDPQAAAPESRHVSPISGAATYSYRFELPPGTGGHTPSLALVYSSDTKHTPYGYGFELNLGRIARSTRWGIPAYTDPAQASGSDRFELDGSLLIREGTTTTFHRLQSDGSRIRYQPTDPELPYTDFWELTRPDGTRLLYGTTPDSRLWGGVGAVQSWGLSEVIDPRGNAYRIAYEDEVGFLYPKAIEYSFHLAGGETADQASRRVEFTWGPRGTDYAASGWPWCYGDNDCIANARSGTAITSRLTHLAAGVDLDHSGALDAAEVVRSWEFVYADKTGTGGDATLPPYSQLRAIQRYGSDGTPFPTATGFSYGTVTRGFDPDPVPGPYWERIGGESQGGPGGVDLERYIYELPADMDGDGFLDRVQGGGTQSWTVTPGGPNAPGYGAPQAWPFADGSSPCLSSVGALVVDAIDELSGTFGTQFYTHRMADLIDMDGDRRPDYVRSNLSGCIEWYRNNGAGFDAAQIFDYGSSLLEGVRTSWTHDETNLYPDVGVIEQHIEDMLADLDGDGRPEYVQGPLAEAVDMDPPSHEFEATTNHLIDLNGDGIPESVGQIQGYYPEEFYTEGGYRQTTTGLADLNGDGLTDFVRSNGSSWWVSFGLGGGRFLGAIAWSAPLGVVAAGHVDQTYRSYFLRDANLDGAADHQFEDDLYLNPGPTGLLRQVTNEQGGVLTFDYRPASELLFEAPGLAEAGLPPEIGPDPNPRWVVTRTTRSDGRPGAPVQVQDFDYAGFRYDPARRESLGARVTRSTDAAGLTTTTTVFAQRPAIRGRVEWSETCDASACWARVETDWQSQDLGGGAYLSRPVETRTDVCDGRDASCDDTAQHRLRRVVRRSFELAPPTGNLLSETDCGADADCAADADNRVQTFAYVRDPDAEAAWMMAYPSQVSTYFGSEAPENLQSQVRIHYDADTFAAGAMTPPVRCDGSASPCGGLPSFRETLRSDDPQAPDPWAVEHRRYDAYGNETEYFDAVAYAEGSAEATRTVTYDAAAYRTFPVAVDAPLLPPDELAFDPGLGEVVKRLGANGHLTCRDFDAFGRLERESERSEAADDLTDPCDSAPLATYQYPDAGDPAAQRVVVTQHPGDPWADVRSVSYLDGLGRVYQTEREYRAGQFDAVSRAWGARGELVCETLPFRTAGGVAAADPVPCEAQYPHREIAYDAVLRPTDVDLWKTESLSVTEVMRSFRINSFLGVPVPFGDVSVEKRTTKGTPDRIQYLARSNRGDIVLVQEQEEVTWIYRDPKGRIVRIDGPDVVLGDDPDDPGAATDPNLLEIAYNAVDQRVRVAQTDAPGGAGPAWRYEYDRNGDLEKQHLPRLVPGSGEHVAIAYHYDDLRRLEHIDYQPFGPNGGDILYAYHDDGPGLGLLEEAGAVNGIPTRYAYDRRGRVTGRARDYTTPEGLLTFSFGYAYDRLDRPLFTFLPDGGWLAYSYDAGQLDQVLSSSSAGQDLRITGLARHPSGALTDLTFWGSDPTSPAARSAYSYDPGDHRPQSAQTWTDPGGPAERLIQDLAYSHDTAGNLLAIADALDLRDETFQYDALHRLTLAVGDPGDTFGYLATSYRYDPAGNLREKGPGLPGAPQAGRLRFSYATPTGAGAKLSAVARHDGAAWVPGVGAYAYDADGGVVSRTKDGATWSTPARHPEGRLQGLQLPGHAPWAPDQLHFPEDHTGARAEKTRSGLFGLVSAQRLYVGADYEVDVLAETHAFHLFVEGRRVATSRRQGLGSDASQGPPVVEGVQLYHPDHVGSNAVISSEGGTVQYAFHAPFGGLAALGEIGPGEAPAQATPVTREALRTDHLFTDQESDVESGLDSFGARHYDPWVGRFWSQDPELIGAYRGVTFGRIPGDSQNQNAYAYVVNRPTVMTDPTGRWGDLWWEIHGPCEDCSGRSQPWSDGIFWPGAAVFTAGLWFVPALPPAVVAAVPITIVGVGIYYTAGGPEAVNSLIESVPSIFKSEQQSGEGEGDASEPTYSDKIERQMGRRGWDKQRVKEAIEKGEKVPARNKANGNPATRHVHPDTGQSVVVDDVTNEVIHVGGPGFSYGPGGGDVGP